MSRFHWRKPSPGLVVATVALVMAMGGVGYAAGGSDTKSDKKIANKAAKSYFNGHIAGASVAHANSSNSSTVAGFAGAAIPRAYGFIHSDGSIDTTRSRNIAAVTHTHTGVDTYCVTPSAAAGIDVAHEFPVATADWWEGAGFAHAVELNSTATCSTSAGPGWVFFTFDNRSTGPVFEPIAFSLIAP